MSKKKFWLLAVPLLALTTPLFLVALIIGSICETVIYWCHELEAKLLHADTGWKHIGDGIYRYDFSHNQGEQQCGGF